MVVQRRDLWWADLEIPLGSGPGFRRPVLIVQADSFNRSRLRTAIVVALTTNPAALKGPGNVLVPAAETGLSRDSIASATLDQTRLLEHIGRVPPRIMARIDEGLRLALDL
jgi:mRNA interferase MazF